MKNQKHPGLSIPLDKKAPTAAEFITHILNGGHFLYASIQHTNDTEKKEFISMSSNHVFKYDIRSADSFIVKRIQFGRAVTINFKLEFIQLIPIQS